MSCNPERWARALLAGCLCLGLAACGGGSDAGLPLPHAPLDSAPAPDNVLPVSVDAGPGGANVNRLYASVTVCQPGSNTRCQTIDHVMVDTGSTGLRLLAEVLDPAITSQRELASNGKVLLNCVQFVDNSYAFGPVVQLDLRLAGMRADKLPVQVIADPAFSAADGGCSLGASATAVSSVESFGAKGILGLGLFKQDCGSACVTNPNNGYYATCADAACRTSTPASASLAQQLSQPLNLFASDSNGFLIDLPGVGTTGANSLSGSLIFGIGSKSNNQTGALTVLTTDASGYLTSRMAERTMFNSFIDSGSNGIFFDSSALASCSSASGSEGFYCPSSDTTLAATLTGSNAASASVSFVVGNAQDLFKDRKLTVLPTLAGPLGMHHGFDWGLPFFYGRRVFHGLDGQSSPLGVGPFIAF